MRVLANWNRRATGALLLGLLAVGVASAGVPRLIGERAWAPLVRLAGEGDSSLAIARLRAGSDTVAALLHRLEIDPATDAFLTDLVSSLEAFDLDGFYEQLPERTGEWRRMRVVGELAGRGYQVSRTEGAGGEVALTARHAAGDLSVAMAARPTPDGSASYQLEAQLGLGVGPIGWTDLRGACSEVATLVAGSDVRHGPFGASRYRPSVATRERLVRSHPNLRQEDIEVLGVLWEAFPQLGDLLHTVARAEDVAVFDLKSDGSYQQARLSARLVPELAEREFPELAEFLADLGPLVSLQARVEDDAGRQWARFGFSTDDLRLTLEGFVGGGRLLPVENGRVLLDPPAVSALTMRMDLRSSVNGVESHLQGLEMDWLLASGADGAEALGSITRVPTVQVRGLEFLRWIVDVAIPGNIDELIREFLVTACRGNDGRGITFAASVRQAGAAEPGVVSCEGAIEVLDSALVSLGMRIVGLQLLPDDAVQADLHRLFAAVHRTFVADLDRFDGLTQPKVD